MGVWDAYETRLQASGTDRRSVTLRREQRFLDRKMPGNLSYKQLLINGEERQLAVIRSDNLDLKNIFTRPGESLPPGGLVEFAGNHWLITEIDADNEVYTVGRMRQCNYLLRWVTDEDRIVERWCIVEDGTKYLTGEYGDSEYVFVHGDTRISLTLPLDEETIKLNRNDRFLIDDYRSPNVLAYRLTKPFKLGGSYNGEGVLYFVLQECAVEDTDNLKLHIANYYEHFPPKEKPGETPDEPDEPDTPDGSDEPDGHSDDGQDGKNGVEDAGGGQKPGRKVWL